MKSKRSPQQISDARGTTTLLNALAAGAFSAFAILNAYAHPTRAPAYVLLWALWLLVTAIWVFGIPGGYRRSRAGRAIIDDELTRAHQAHAARAGLAIALVGLVALSLCGFARVALPVWTLPALTSATVVLTGLVFARLQMRA